MAEDVLIEESATSFTETAHAINMLPEDHIAYDHVNRLLHTFENMGSAVDAFKFTSDITMDDIKAMQKRNDDLSDTLDEMATIMSSRQFGVDFGPN
jgi:hypothetical protein